MKIYSFTQHGIELRPIEVEISLLPGLPQFQIMGLPDPAIKESQLRIKSALKHQGFDWPAGKQVLINLRPTDIRKKGKGLDLAIALAYLWKTGQLTPPQEEKVYVYGELSLSGEVTVADDLHLLFSLDEKQPIITGRTDKPYHYPLITFSNLRDFDQCELVPGRSICEQMVRPPLPDLKVNAPMAELMAIAGTGEHSVMLAGPAGSGKSFFAEHLYPLLRDPSEAMFRRSFQLGKLFGREVSWRPYVAPHHSATPQAMIGGGYPVVPGEITRAHGGVLLLDEFLEINNKVTESLREPLETGQIALARKGGREWFPAYFMLMATTNLCPCGDMVPGRMMSCRFSLGRCRSYSERLSGPILDRFQILVFSHLWQGDDEVPLSEIRHRIQAAQQFAYQTRGQATVNARVPIESLTVTLEPFLRKSKGGGIRVSRRRMEGIIRTARSIADLDASMIVYRSHWRQAEQLSLVSFKKMSQLFN